MYDIEWLIYQNFCQSQNSAKVLDNFQALMCDFIEESKKIWQSYGQKTLPSWHSSKNQTKTLSLTTCIYYFSIAMQSPMSASSA